VLWVFGQHGVRVPRTVADLFAAGDRLRPGMMPGAGDLVFFDTEGRGPSHVGIALGNGSFVHAPSRRGVVRVESLASPYWVERYLGARRLLSEDRRRAGR
jgi:cell wall-associated NlpC family hydrolase